MLQYAQGCYLNPCDTKLVLKLVKSGASVNAVDPQNGFTVLMRAIIAGFPSDAIQVLVQAGANVNAAANDGTTPLMLEVLFSSPSSVAALAGAGAAVNAEDSKGETALMYVAEGPYSEPRTDQMAEVLIRAGADLNLKSRDGQTALSIAKKNGAPPSFLRLLGAYVQKVF